MTTPNSSAEARFRKAQGAAKMVANMLRRDGTAVRIEAADELESAIAALTTPPQASAPAKLQAALDELEFNAGAGRISAMALFTKMRDLCKLYATPTGAGAQLQGAAITPAEQAAWHAGLDEGRRQGRASAEIERADE